MAIYIDNLRVEDCKICVDVGEDSNAGADGTLSIYVSGTLATKKDVKLYFPLRKECVEDTPKTGNICKVKAILRGKGSTRQMTQLIKLCN